MFDGYTESPRKIAARPKPVYKTLPPMTREQWEAMPAAFKFFHSWERASQPLTVRVV